MKWPVKKLSEICEINIGRTPSRSNANYWKNGEYAWLSISDMTRAVDIIETKEKISNLAISECNCKLVPINTVLLSFKLSIGKVGINKIPLYTNEAIAALPIKQTKILSNRFLFHALKNTNFTEGVDRAAKGLTLNKEKLKEVKIPLPPLAEQQRIAALLDTADHILKLRESAIAKLDQLVQSVFVDMFSNCTNFESIKSVVLKKKITPPEVDQQVWSLSLDQIESNTGTLQHKMMVDFKKLGNSTFYFEPPVVLYSKLRPYLNKVFMPTDCGYATTELVPLYCNGKKVLPIYLLSVLRSKKFVEFANINSGGAKMPRVIMDKFWDYEFAVPSIQQQQKYADFFTSILNQKRYCLHVYSLNKALLSSLQHQSFAVN